MLIPYSYGEKSVFYIYSGASYFAIKWPFLLFLALVSFQLTSTVPIAQPIAQTLAHLLLMLAIRCGYIANCACVCSQFNREACLLAHVI